ncbi:hypothetical protein BDW66DRAFT_123566 [Aspergillus desertorum]
MQPVLEVYHWWARAPLYWLQTGNSIRCFVGPWMAASRPKRKPPHLTLLSGYVIGWGYWADSAPELLDLITLSCRGASPFVSRRTRRSGAVLVILSAPKT